MGGPRPSSQAIWSQAPPDLVLPQEEVHVWRASLNLSPGDLNHFYQALGPIECEQVARLSSSPNRGRAQVARAILRMILSRYIGAEPRALRFSYNPYGKPELAPPFNSIGLRFNLSHSHGVAIYAVARGRAVGIDLERIREGVPVEQLARRFFSPREVAMLNEIPERARKKAFFTCWTRKEAYVKARGVGLFSSFRHFTVSLAQGEPAHLVDVEGDPQELLRWTFWEFTPVPGYIASLVVEGHGFRVRYWKWSGGWNRVSPGEGARAGGHP